MIIASISNVCKSYSTITVLDNICLAVQKGDKIGLVGPNGTGKTTLLEIIYGLIEIDKGSVDVIKSIKTGYLPQSFSELSQNNQPAGISMYDFVKKGCDDLLALDDEIKKFEKKIADNKASKNEKNRYSEALHEFEFRGGYSIETNVEKVMAGLGFSRDVFDQNVSKLSGGEKNRLLLARLLLSSPDLMLLDEPTNHLDIAGIEFLENYLSDSSAGSIVVSHDRRFLDRTVNNIWEIYAARIKAFPGNYSNYLLTKQKQDELELKAYTQQREFINKTKTFIAKNIAGQKTKQAQSRRKMLSKLKRLDKPLAAQKGIGISFGEVERSDRIVTCFKDVDFGYNNRPLLTGVEFTIERNEKIGLIGSNGSGKTTILELITGSKLPERGEIINGKKIKLGYFQQARHEFNPQDRVIDVIGRALPQYTEGKHRDYLARFLFTGEDVFRQIGTFSGGQKSRLALAALMAGQSNFLVLDEPTNHLDILSREALEKAMYDYAGTLLVVSHDRFFLDNVVDKIFALQYHKVKTYPGNYSYYEEKKLEMFKQTVSDTPSKKPKMPKTKNKRINPLIIKKLKDEIEALETELSKLYDEIDSEKYASNWEKLQTLQVHKEEIEKNLIRMYEKLENMSAKG